MNILVLLCGVNTPDLRELSADVPKSKQVAGAEESVAGELPLSAPEPTESRERGSGQSYASTRG